MKDRKMLVKLLSLRVSPLGILQKERLHLFLGLTENDILSILPGKTTNHNMSKKEYLTMRSMQNDRSVAIKPASKEFAVVVWDRIDYLKEAERQLSDEKTNEEIRITEKD